MKHRTTTIAVWIVCGLSAAAVAGCKCGEKQPPKEEAKAPEEKAPTHGLTPEQASKVLFKVGDTTVTVGQFAERLADQSPYLRARYQTPERRREFLEEMVKFELLAMEAFKRGYGKKPEVERVRKQKMVEQMMKQLFDESGVLMSEITDTEIRDYYDQHQDEFHKKAQVRASHILFDNKKKAEEVLKQVLAKPDDMKAFRDLVKEHTKDKDTVARLGDLRFFSSPRDKKPDEPDVPDPVREAAFTLQKTGDVYSSVVESDKGFHIVKLTGKRNAYHRTLEQARRSIQNRLWRERREKAIDKFVKELRAKAKVKENQALLEQIQVGAGEPGPPGAPGGPVIPKGGGWSTHGPSARRSVFAPTPGNQRMR